MPGRVEVPALVDAVVVGVIAVLDEVVATLRLGTTDVGGDGSLTEPDKRPRGAGPPRDGEPHNLQDRVARFEERSGRAPADYVQAWRSGEFDDNPENARLAIEALALRAALEQPSLSG